MDRKYSLALHDLRISEGRNLLGIIEGLRNHFQIPLTIHLVFDEDFDTQPELLMYLKNQAYAGNLEIVFHGLKHSCSKNVLRLWAFFHKYQAEYLENDAGHREATRKCFATIEDEMATKLGICPPCWLASKENNEFFQSLQPLYIESLLSLRYQGKKVISPVISLGSSRRLEVFFLEILADTICLISSILRLRRVRIAMHLCDLDIETSRLFFDNIISRFNGRGFKPVLLRELN